MEQSTPKIIVYSAIFGGYDRLREVEVVDPNVKYILFTDSPNLKSKTWDIQLVSQQRNSRLYARSAKINNAIITADCDYYIWIDARFSPRCSNWLELCQQVEGVMCYRHDVRDCIYEEAKVCKEMKLDSDYAIDTMVKKLKRVNYPSHFGLQSSGFLIRKNIKAVQAFNEDWLKCVSIYSVRDQLSLNYVAWEHGIKIQQPPKGVNVYDNPYLSKGNKHLKPRTL